MRAGAGLVVVQIALAFVLLSGAALLVRSFVRVTAVDPGFRVDHLLTMRVFLGPPTYRSIESQRQFAERALEILRQTPGVKDAGAVSQPPFDIEGSGAAQRFVVEGRTHDSGAQPSLNYRTADAGYAQTIGLRLDAWPLDYAGGSRRLAQSPRRQQTMARRFFPDSDPIGARITGGQSGANPLTIVGVVADVATNGLERAETPAAYGPHTQRVQPFLRWLTFVVRTEGDPAAVAGALRAGVQTVDPRQPIFAVRTMDEIVARSLAERRFSLLLMAAFAGLTVILATLLPGCSRSESSSAGVRSACACRSARPAEGCSTWWSGKECRSSRSASRLVSPPATRSAAWSSR